MIIKHSLSLLFFVTAIGFQSLAYDFSTVVNGTTWYYNLISNDKGGYDAAITYHSLSGHTYSGDVIIPAALKGYTVTTIGTMAFDNCSSLTSIKIPNSVTVIEDYAFYNCSSLTSITIPDSVTTIGNNAFYGCNSLTSFMVDGRNSNYCSINGMICSKDGQTLFCGVNGDVEVPNSVITIGSHAFDGCRSLRSVDIPDSVVSIENRAFEGCVALSQIIIPEGVKTIGDYAFYNCSSLVTIDMPREIASIGFAAFYNCSSLKSIDIPSGLSFIAGSAFYECASLESVVIPFGVERIGRSAFDKCSAIKSVKIPYGVTAIGDSAFYDCSQLEAVDLPISLSSIGGSAFNGCKSLKSLIIPYNVSSIGTFAFARCNSLESVTLVEDIKSIGVDPFGGCYSIKYLNLCHEDIDYQRFNLPEGIKVVDATSVIINGAVDEVIYDGKCHSYRYTIIASSSEFPIEEVCLRKPLVNECCDVGNYELEIASSDFEIPDSVKTKFPNIIILTSNPKMRIIPREIVISSVSHVKKYDGEYVTSRIDLSIEQELYHDFGVRVEGEIVNVGTCKSKIYIDWTSPDKEANYKISFEEGVLTILPRSVSITSGSASKVYDGTPLTALCSIGGDGFVDGECDVSVSSRTAAGSSKNAITLNWAEGASASNYDITIEEGELTVLPRSVSITTGSASKVYDGKPLTASYSIGGDGFVDGECVVVAESSQTGVGSCKNAITLNWADGIRVDNYKITMSEGTLTILPAKVPRIAMGAFSTTYSYDGEEHTINVAGVESTTLIDPPRFSYALSAEGPWQDEAPSFKDAGVYTVWYKISADNYEDYIQEACVTILPRKMVIASGDAEKFYDGVPLMCSSAEVTAGGPVDGETFTVNFTGAQLDEGESQNTFDIVWDDPANASNYEVLKYYGTLKVTRLFGDVGDDTISATYPYSYKSLTEVSFTEGVEAILASQFYGCVSLQSVKFPDSLRVIDCHALDGLPNVEWQIIDGYKIMDGWIFGYTEDAADEISNVDDIRGIAAGALKGCKALKRFVCTKNAKLKTINARAFKDMYWLEEVSLPDSLISIGDSAFEGCTELYTISFGNGLRDIGAAAFRDCITLETISLGEGLASIGEEAFSATADTMRLKSVSLPATLQSIGWNVFKGCELIRGATTPSGILAAKDLFPDAYDKITSYVVAEGSTAMVNEMFKGCECLSYILLPESLMQIGESAFEDCQSLIEIGLPDAVTTLGRYAFRNCYNLKTIGLPKELNAIEDGTFVNCPMLDSLIVPASVNRIGSQIYSGGTWYSLDADPSILGKAEKPYSSYGMETRQGVEAIWYRFENVSRLKAVYFLGDAPEVDSSIYVGTPDDLTSYVIKGSTGWYREGSPTLPTSGWPTVETARTITYWQPNVFDVTFDANGGLPETYSLQQITDTTYSLPKVAPSREGYLFDGWWTERIDGARITANSRVTAKNAHTLYAHWSQRTDMVTVRFNPNGGTVSPEEVTYNLNVTYGSLPVPTRIGHAFVGWHTSPIGGTEIIEASMVDKVVNELYAQWKPITYLVRFNANGAIGQSYQQEHTYNASDKLSLNTFTKEGFAFVGWSLTPGGSADFANNQEVENLGEVQDQVVDLYAVWKAATYAVRFDGNGGAGNMANQTHDVGSSQTLSKQQFKRIGYIFSGWAVTPTGNVIYGDEESVSNLTFVNNATVVLYAVWTPGSYSIVYHANDGTQSLFSESAIWDRDYVIADNRFVRDGYEFVGWTVGDDGVVAYMPMMNVRNIAEDAGDQVCLYAVWEKSAAVDPTNVAFTNAGDADWQNLSQLVTKADGAHSVATPVVWQSGKIADNQSSILKTKVSGKGKLEFWWRVSCESFRTQKLDHLSFMVDGDEVKWINGEQDWTYFEHEILTSGEHEIAWAYNKDDMESDGEDCGAVCAVVWTPRLTNLADYLNADELAFSISGDAEWFGTSEVSHDGAGAAQSGKIGDNQKSRLETTVVGEGTISFWWKVDCEAYRTYKLDHAAFSIDGVEQKWINGDKDWMRESFEVKGAGAHTLTWLYAKDEEGSDGEDCAWVDEIVWTPAQKPTRPEVIEVAGEEVQAAFDKWIVDNNVTDPSAANVNAFIMGLAPNATEEEIQEQVEAEIENIDLSKLATDPVAAVEAIQTKYPNAKVELAPVEGLKTSARLYKLVIELK